MTRRFVKLDTRVVAGFDAALGERSMTVRTGTSAVLGGLMRRRGLGAAAASLVRALAGRAAPLVEGNVTRKRIRVPAVFGNRAVAGFYGWIKAVQAGVLADLLGAVLQDEPDRVALVYNGSLYPESVLAHVAGRLNRDRLFVEAGFFPGTLQVDPVGLNAANSVPRDPAFYVGAEDFAAEGLPARVNDRPAKAGGPPPVDLAPGYVFVPFQVPSDMQVTLHSPWVTDMLRFLDIVRAAADRHPDEVFVIKEHPSFKRSVRGLRPDHPRVVFANGNVTSRLIEGARAVMTLNSTVGIEALLMERPVIVLGRACYDIEGLVLRAGDPEALDAAIRASRDWAPDPALRRGFLGYLWNRYLLRGRYDDLPADLADALERRLAPPG